MNKLATLFRAAQLYAHNAHNLAYGPTFFQDHEFLSELYSSYEEAYDDVVERMIGLGKNVNLPEIAKSAADSVVEEGAFKSTSDCFQSLLELEMAICSAIKSEMPKATDGTQNLLQGLADDSEKRQYKIQQRLKS